MKNSSDGKAYLLAMARAMQGVGRLGDFVTGLAHEGATGSLATLLEEFGPDAFKGGAEALRLDTYKADYIADAYDAAVASERPDVVAWLAENKVPVVGVRCRAAYNDRDQVHMHYNAVLRALHMKDDASLCSMVEHGLVDLNAALMTELGLKRRAGEIVVSRHAAANDQIIVTVRNVRLLDLCAVYGLPLTIRAILDGGYAATPSFFAVALGIADMDLIDQSIGKAKDVKAIASRMLAAATASSNLPGMRLALAHGGDPNGFVEGFGSEAQSRPLFFCSSASAVNLLCDAGAILEVRNKEDMTPALYFASKGESAHVPVLRALAGRGADFTKRAKGRTISQLAATKHADIKQVIRAAKTGSVVANAVEPVVELDDAPAAPRMSGLSPL